MKQETFDFVTVINVATRILAAKVLSMVCLFMTFGLFCWAMYMQAVLACVVAGGFAVFVFLPVLWGQRGSEMQNG